MGVGAAPGHQDAPGQTPDPRASDSDPQPQPPAAGAEPGQCDAQDARAWGRPVLPRLPGIQGFAGCLPPLLL